jgi:signal transduction histidine kinase
MRYVATWLIYLAVLTRAVGWMQDSPAFPAGIWLMLALFGLMLALEPQLTRRWPGFPRLYVTLQSVLLVGMLYTAPILDFLPMLFFPLSFQAVQFFGARGGSVWIGVFSLAMLGMILTGLEWGDGIVMLLLTSSVDVLMGSFAHHISRTEQVHLENQRLFGELQAAYRSLKGDTAQAEALAAAEARHCMVRELHDSLTQTLFSMNLAVQAAQLSAGSDRSQAEGHLRRLQSLARSAAGEVRALTAQRPAPLQVGLWAALEKLSAERFLQDGLEIRLEVSAGQREQTLRAAEVENLYRIVQEALNNIAKHSGASQAVLRLDLSRRPACIEVADAGCGFDPQAIDRSGGLGLAEMAERAGEIGWLLQIDSAPGQGTRIRIMENIG